jgi:two-component system OmpR family response regulator
VGAPHRVLLIEDDPALREMLCAALADEGYRVLPSDHPVAPLDVQQLRPSLVVLDLMLGGEPEGYGWLEAVRSWSWTARLPVLVCSGYLAPDAPAAQRVQALAGVTVPKPFSLDLFLGAVAGCVTTAAAPQRA